MNKDFDLYEVVDIEGVRFIFKQYGINQNTYDPTTVEEWEFELPSGQKVFVNSAYGATQVFVNEDCLGYFEDRGPRKEGYKIFNRKNRATFSWMFRSLSGIPLERVERAYDKAKREYWGLSYWEYMELKEFENESH